MMLFQRIKLIGFIGALFGCLISASVMATSAATGLIEQLQVIKGLSGTFKQTQTDSEGEFLSDAEGEFFIARPGNLYWKTILPFEQLLVSDGESLWLYDEDLEQVTISPVGEQLKNSPAIIFSGDLAVIETRYNVSINDDGSYKLRPKHDDNGFQYLDLFFRDSSLVAMALLDSFGQETRFDFVNVQLNPTIEPELFHFDVPEGTDVLTHE